MASIRDGILIFLNQVVVALVLLQPALPVVGLNSGLPSKLQSPASRSPAELV